MKCEKMQNREEFLLGKIVILETKEMKMKKETLEDESDISGYTLYAPKQKEKTKVNDLPEFYPELPDNMLSL